MHTSMIFWCIMGMPAIGADYVEHQHSYCEAISCTDSHCTGGIHYGNETEAACRSLCDAARCLCFDWRDGTKAHPHPKQPNCRLTNSSADYKQSGYGYTAFVSTTAPPKPPQPTAGAWINYGCRDEFAKLPFCNTSKTLEARLDALVAALTTAEKASQLVARSSPPIDRLGIPFFCWGQNAVNALMPQQLTAFPIAPAMAATFNMTAVTALGAAIANNARVLFNRRTSNHSSGYTCPGSIGECLSHEAGACLSLCTQTSMLLIQIHILFPSHPPHHVPTVTWGPTINIIRDPRWGRNFEVPSEDPFLTGAYAAAWTRGAQQGEDKRYLKTIVTVKHWAAYSVGALTIIGVFEAAGGADRSV